jgi:hypothetical protein
MMFSAFIMLSKYIISAKKFSPSKLSLVFISTNNVIDRLTDAPTQTTTKRIALFDEQFTSIQDLCDEF